MKERILIVGLLITVAALALQTCFRKEKQVSDLTQVVKIKQDTITLWRDKAGLEHGQKQLAEADFNTIKVVYQAEIDSLTKVLGIKESQLQSYTGVSTRASGEIRLKVDTIYLADSSRQYDFDYKDRWLSVNGSLGKLPKLSYVMFDSLALSVYNKRKNFFAPYKTYIDVYSLNPNVRVTGLTGFRINAKMPGRFGLGPYIGYGWFNGQWSPSAGIALQYTLIRF